MDTNSNDKETYRQPPDEPYLQTEDSDYLARMNMELLSELWIARDRVAILEQVLIDKGLIEADAVDTFVPDEAMTQRLDSLRQIVVENVIGAPFKNNHSVKSLMERGQALARSVSGKTDERD